MSEVVKAEREQTSLLVLEDSEFGLKQFRGGFDGRLSIDSVTVVLQILGTVVNQPSHNVLLVFDGRRDEGSDFFNGHEVTVILTIRVGHVPKERLELL